MYMTFQWEGSDTVYHVTNYSLSLQTFGDTKLANCVPGEITMSLELPAQANPASEFLAFAVDQHNTASDKGKGTLTVFKGHSVGESLQEVAFVNGWVTDLDFATSEHDEKFQVTVNIAAADVTVSGVQFVHRGRSEHF